MAVNPIQKEKNNATILGAVIGIIMGIVVTLGVLMILNPDLLSLAGTSTSNDPMIDAIVLKTDITSGTTLTEANVNIIKVKKSLIPSDSITGSITVGSTAKIDLKAGTVLSAAMLNQPGETVKKSTRRQEYNMISLPSKIAVGNFVDIRLVLPTGQDFIVITKKRVQDVNDTTIWIDLDEEETLVMSNAIVEHYIMAGSKLYATTYTDAGLQGSIATYVPNSAVATLINANSNNGNITSGQIVDGTGRYTDTLKALRNSTINKALNSYEDEEASKNLEEKIANEIKSLQERRATYYNMLNAAVQ